ncbi:hypothetical protein [Rubrivirga sp.]|uniref:hypothetical protein n=1 Tax=Rubrivirga sp. TaxID=1885344 RepID=UPI003B5173EA
MALLTLGLTGVFFAVGVVVLRQPPADAAADDTTAPSDSSAVAAAPGEVAALSQELAQMQGQLAAAEARADSLRDVIEGRQDGEAESSTTAAELATTVTKLDDDALGEVVQRLDGRSFVRLYQAASARNRSRLLDALTPAQAAAFVRHQLPGGASVPLHTASARDSSKVDR